MQLWHEWLAHMCQQYLKTVVDKGLIRGVMITQWQIGACDACHIGKQKRKKHRKKLERGVTVQNQVVAERQASRNINTVIQQELEIGVKGTRFPIQRVLTDKCGAFVNEDIDRWYAAKGIVHVKVGPKSSRLNPCERAHEPLIEMTKTTMQRSGLPRSFWPEALRNAVYVKNRVYNKAIEGIPYEKMFGMKPDIHPTRMFGALAYVRVPKTPGRSKHQDNAKIGFVLGYAEHVVRCKVYLPDERRIKFAADVRLGGK
ncbi:Transposon polyprotein integrase, partial [Globisporangium splendens]